MLPIVTAVFLVRTVAGFFPALTSGAEPDLMSFECRSLLAWWIAPSVESPDGDGRLFLVSWDESCILGSLEVSLVLIDCSIVPSFAGLVCDDGFAVSAEKDAEGDGSERSDLALVLDMIGRGEVTKRYAYSVDSFCIQFTFLSFVPMNCGKMHHITCRYYFPKTRNSNRQMSSVRENSKNRDCVWPSAVDGSARQGGRRQKAKKQSPVEQEATCVGCCLTMRPVTASNRRKRPHQSIGASSFFLVTLAGLADPSSCFFQLPTPHSRHTQPFKSSTFRTFPCASHIASPLKISRPAFSDFNRPYPNVIISNDLSQNDLAELAARYLHRYGVCALIANDVTNAGGIVSSATCDAASTAAQERLAELHRRIESRGEDPNGAEGEYRYLEVVCRDPGGNRFDMPVGWMADDVENEDGECTSSSFDHPGMPLEQKHENALEAFHSEVDCIVSPVVQRLFDSYETESDESASMSIVSAGFLINRPGSTAQKWHKDGPDQGFIDAFVPLIDVSAELGPTEVEIGTHEENDVGESGDEVTSIWENQSSSVAPELRKGEILLLDYRTLHRGLGNASPSTTRPLAYSVYKHEKASDGETSGDVRNFPAATTLEFD